jgi:hypothetical protein
MPHRFHSPRRALRAALFAIAASLVWLTPSAAAELVMFRLPGCRWCAAWDREVGPIYPKTRIGQLAPVRFVDLREAPVAGVSLARPVRYSPTFVVVVDGREIGRIEGYPGDAFFWGLLEKYTPQLMTAEY